MSWAGELSSKFLTNVGSWLVKLGASQGFCRGSVTSPMMGSTPYGVAGRRTCPSSVRLPAWQRRRGRKLGVQRHTVEHIVDFVCFAPVVQILDAPVPQMVEELPDILRFFDTLTPDPEQVFEAPQILPGEEEKRGGGGGAE